MLAPLRLSGHLILLLRKKKKKSKTPKPPSYTQHPFSPTSVPCSIAQMVRSTTQWDSFHVRNDQAVFSFMTVWLSLEYLK